MPLDHLALERARVVQRRAPAAPAAGWRTGRAPCAGRAGPARGAAWPGRSCPTSGPPTAASSTASARRQASSVSSVSAVPWASIDGAAEQVLLVRRAPGRRRRSTSTAGAMISGPMPSPGSSTIVAPSRRRDGTERGRRSARRDRHVEPHVVAATQRRRPQPARARAVDERVAQLAPGRADRGGARGTRVCTKRARIRRGAPASARASARTSVNPARSRRAAVVLGASA